MSGKRDDGFGPGRVTGPDALPHPGSPGEHVIRRVGATPHEWLSDKRLKFFCVVALFLFFGFFYIQILHRIQRQGHLSDFRHFYAAAVAMRNGQDIYRSGTHGYVYPPLLAFCLQPLARLSSANAAAAALSITVPLMLLCTLCGAREALSRLPAPRDSAAQALALRRSPDTLWFVVSFLTAIITFGRIKAELQMLQVDVLTLAAYVLALRWVDRRPMWSGAILGLALNIKYYTLPALLYLAFRRRWSAMLAMIAAAIGGALLPAISLGWSGNLRALETALAGVLHSVGINTITNEMARVHGVQDTLSISITSGIARLTDNREPYFFGAVVLVMAATLAFIIMRYQRERLPLWRWPRARRQTAPLYRALFAIEWCGLMIGSIIFSPDANMRHMVLVLYANALAATLLLTAATRRERLHMMVAIGIELLAFDGIGKLAGRHGGAAFFLAGGPAWAALIFFLMLLAAALKRFGERPQNEDRHTLARVPATPPQPG